ncbi:hypothetical protein HALLA_14075 [Halostagnicola larsenii XH-48]|uniref:DUF1616 domain-containing protein n=1 Tax=Halostagnicola larsenii XH-48 TaxID=797299 RepID=W0JMB6_9EURY|nr:DUF1616 domain-containing protein [Halostagnicola larsenii]AHF99743.1 hypothetical protein HALLA_14075 [Halostagnicola larsenii XH-48]
MSDTNWWFIDLALVIAGTGAITLGLFGGVSGYARILLALPLVLLFPGYALVAAIFPDTVGDDQQSFDDERTGLGRSVLLSGGIEPIERFILSIAFSVALIPGITLITSVTPWGVTSEPVLFGVSLATICLALIAIVSRYRVSPEDRFAPSRILVLPMLTGSESSPYNRTNTGRTNTRPYNVALVVGLCLLIASAGFAVANPAQPDGFTEFSVETDEVDGDTETMYEPTFTAGESQDVPISITNQEQSDQTYTVVVLFEQVEYGEDSTTVTERERLTNKSISVSDGQTHNESLEITPPTDGENHRLTLLLYTGDPPSDPTAENAYERVRLPIEVQ